ncbi:hypothetical protein FOPE_04546 [Fonsecaea pedrosoi]|nr:hypothetical protein FOPE_04546 [Fonsecaea pedrosoi]
MGEFLSNDDKSLKSDLSLDLAAFHKGATTTATRQLNSQLIELGLRDTKWWKCGAREYRQRRAQGATPFPRPMLLGEAEEISIESNHGPAIKCRLFQPPGAKPIGVFYHIHGGGYVLGSADRLVVSSLATTRGLVTDANGTVKIFSWLRSLGPLGWLWSRSNTALHQKILIQLHWKIAAPSPTGLNSTHKKSSQWDCDLNFIGGESAGATLSALVVLHLQQRGLLSRIRGVVLSYGNFDLSALPSLRGLERSETPILNYEDAEQFLDAYLPGRTPDQRKAATISPAYNKLSDLVPALFLVGTEDGLVDDSILMASRWQLAGNEAILKFVPGACHGFMTFNGHVVEKEDVVVPIGGLHANSQNKPTSYVAIDNLAVVRRVTENKPAKDQNLLGPIQPFLQLAHHRLSGVDPLLELSEASSTLQNFNPLEQAEERREALIQRRQRRLGAWDDAKETDMAPSGELVALVTGANGVTGDYLIRQLASEPQWTKIIATSRRRPFRLSKDPRVVFGQADLNSDVGSISQALRDMGATKVTHFFHMAYIHHDAFEKQYEYNVKFFINILTAVDDINKDTLQRVVLQNGAKYYGFHFKAPPKEPVTEDLGRLGLEGPPNFYYPQEDFMFELQKHRKWTWSTTRPFLISGFSFGSGQSFTCTAALYFTMQKYLGEPAVFSVPSEGEGCYEKRQDFSSAANIAAFTTRLALHPNAQNQSYNIVDADPKGLTFREIWESMGQYFGVPVTTRAGFDIEADIESKLKRGVWEELVAKHGGDKDACDKFATWSFFGWIMRYATWGASVSMDKAARELGWTTRFDTRKDLCKIFDTMKLEGVIPQL